LSEDLIAEVCRFAGAEIHPVAAFIGGVASQEVIKVCYPFLAEVLLSYGQEYVVCAFVGHVLLTCSSAPSPAGDQAVCAVDGNIHIQWNRSQISSFGVIA
jgi:hypothetical protein